MNRNLKRLEDDKFDVLIIGGGIYGASVAWEAALRGLSVALIERDDFGHATSANSLKTIHGGLRYLQHAHFGRMRESIRERTALMRIAPHLVHPLPCLMPTYGHYLKGKEIMTIAMLLNDIISFDRNKRVDPQKHLPRGHTISRRECLDLLPNIPKDKLTGGAVWYDAQVYNSERLTLSYILSAVNKGAQAANYVKATGFLFDHNGNVAGVKATDALSENQLEINAKIVVNTAGPWADQVLGFADGAAKKLGITLARAINVIVSRPLFKDYAVAISSRREQKDSEALINKGRPMLFISPWRGRSMVGTIYVPHKGEPTIPYPAALDVEQMITELNEAYPAANLTPADVSFVHCGLVPSSGINAATGSVQRAKKYKIQTHQSGGAKGLLSVLGVKYTTARDVAEKVVDQIFKLWEMAPPPSKSATTPLHGGEVEDFEAFKHNETDKLKQTLSDNSIRSLLYNYGTAYSQVLRPANLSQPGQPGCQAVRKAEVIHNIREEMAQKLTDVVFRRTDIATAAHPGNEALELYARTMAAELKWNSAQIKHEIAEVNKFFAWEIR